MVNRDHSRCSFCIVFLSDYFVINLHTCFRMIPRVLAKMANGQRCAQISTTSHKTAWMFSKVSELKRKYTNMMENYTFIIRTKRRPVGTVPCCQRT